MIERSRDNLRAKPVRGGAKYHATSVSDVSAKMLKTHKEIVLSNLTALVENTDLNKLIPELLQEEILTDSLIQRILDPRHHEKRQKTDLYTEILNRGPNAFEGLLRALKAAEHVYLVNLLTNSAMEQSRQIRRSSSLNSVGSSNSHSSTDTDGPCFSTEKQKPRRNEMGTSRADGFPYDLTPLSSVDNCPKEKIFKQPSYDWRMDCSVLVSDKKFAPVNVILATSFCESNLRVKPYKNDRNPRGCALIVNNINFVDKEYGTRTGADNDDYRLALLWQQFHYDVEHYRDKTRQEMLDITARFSRKEALKTADSIIVTFMSHGEEGDAEEDSKIVGVDGLSVSSMEIISYFFNDNPYVIDKAKLFFMQSCRGQLVDPGVKIPLSLEHSRIEYDGRAVGGLVVRQSKIVRTCSDIFIARPVPPGKQCNRDKITGTWFIQAIVDVFAEHAHNTHLEDLMKMVDLKIKCLNNLYAPNFQTLTTNTMGWNRHFFFNPGLARDQQTGETIYLSPKETKSVDECEGMDVVDKIDSSPGKSSDAGDNCCGWRQGKKFEDEEDDDDDEKTRKRQSRCGIPSCIAL